MSVHAESLARGYSFDRSKFTTASCGKIVVTEGQLEYEWDWLMGKLRRRNPRLHRAQRGLPKVELHPLFRLRPGPIASWEKL